MIYLFLRLHGAKHLKTKRPSAMKSYIENKVQAFLPTSVYPHMIVYIFFVQTFISQSHEIEQNILFFHKIHSRVLIVYFDL